MKQFLKHSLKLYSRYIPAARYTTIAGIPGVQEYPLDAETVGMGVFKVMIPRLDPIAPLLLSSGPRLDIFGYRYSYPYRDISELAIDYFYFSEATRILSSDFDWEYFDNKLHIHPAPDESFALTYVSAHIRDEYDIPLSDLDWIQEHVLAQTMRAVGLTRRKFVIPGAQSGQTLDGAQMVQDAKELLRQTEEELYYRTPPFAIMRS
jgi:hypothetical protein